jgi:cation transport ATPase
MGTMTEKQYRQELEKVKRENTQRQFKQSLRDEKAKYKRKFKIETSKLIAFYLFALLNAIVVYAMVAMWKFADLSYLGVLITDIAAQILIYGIYCLKAYKAKKSEEDLKFRRERHSLDELLKAGAESDSPVPLTNANLDDFTANQNPYEDSVG